jgi:hypothetical protein
MDPLIEERMKREHHEKYERLTQLLGVATLRALVPVSADRIRQALAAGDEHLNSIPMALWDRATGVRSPFGEKEVCPCCGTIRRVPCDGGDWPYNELRRTARTAPWSAAPTLSLAERTCVLKHVARYHLED